ncbi:MAG: fibronectin type III domain-containing protein [Actinomycetota bacterium]
MKVFVVSAPAAPTISVMATGASGQLSVGVTKPDDGGSTITSYEYSVDNGTPVSVAFGGSNYQSITISSLTNGTSYSIKVRAVNGIGAGAWSAPSSGTPSGGSGGGGGGGGGIPSVIPLPASTWNATCSNSSDKSFSGYTTSPSNSFDFLLVGCTGTGSNVFVGIQSAGTGVQTQVGGLWGNTSVPTIVTTVPTKNDLTTYQRMGSIMGVKLAFNTVGTHKVFVANDACYNSLATSSTSITTCASSNLTTFTFSITSGGGSGGGSGGSGGSATCTPGAETIVGASPGVDTAFGGGWQEIAPASATEGSYGGIVKTSDNALLVVNGFAAPSGGSVQLRKFDLNGSPVTSFGQSGVLNVDVSSSAESSVSVRGVSVGPDGDVTVNGVYLVGASAVQNYFILKLTASGAVDTSFDPSGVAGVLDFTSLTSVMRTATLKNGSVLVVQSNPNGIKKYDATGAVVAGFAGTGMLSLISSGVLIAPTNDGGFFTQTALGDVVVSRYDGSGVLTSWAGAGTKTLGDPNASDATGGLKLTSTGLLVAYNTSTASGGTPAYIWKVTKLDETTGAEATFGTGGTVATTWSQGRATGIYELSDGSIAVSGVLFDTFGPTAAMIKVTAAGAIDSAFSSAPASFLHGSCSLALSAGGTLSYGGIVPVADGKFVALMSKFDTSNMMSQVIDATLVRLDFGLSGSGGGSSGGSAPTLVTSSNQASLVRAPGSEGMIVNGQPVTIESTRVEISAARTPASQRTPAQVASIQAAGQALLQQYIASLPAGAVTSVAVVNTTTGAVMRNLVFDASGNSLDVPVEDIVILDGPAISLMIGSNNANITSDGKYQVGAGGIIGVVGSGLGASAPGELVVRSTPTLIGNFTTSATGDVSKSAALPSSIGVGDHTLVVATGSTFAVMGLRVVPSSLPTTGLTDNGGRTVVIALFTLVFAAVLVRSRRLTLLPR